MSVLYYLYQVDIVVEDVLHKFIEGKFVEETNGDGQVQSQETAIKDYMGNQFNKQYISSFGKKLIPFFNWLKDSEVDESNSSNFEKCEIVSDDKQSRQSEYILKEADMFREMEGSMRKSNGYESLRAVESLPAQKQDKEDEEQTDQIEETTIEDAKDIKLNNLNEEKTIMGQDDEDFELDDL